MGRPADDQRPPAPMLDVDPARACRWIELRLLAVASGFDAGPTAPHALRAQAELADARRDLERLHDPAARLERMRAAAVAVLSEGAVDRWLQTLPARPTTDHHRRTA